MDEHRSRSPIGADEPDPRREDAATQAKVGGSSTDGLKPRLRKFEAPILGMEGEIPEARAGTGTGLYNRASTQICREWSANTCTTDAEWD